MKSSLYFGIKLEKRALLHKLKSYSEKTSKEHPKTKITENKNKKQIANKQKYDKNKTKKNAWSNFRKKILNIQNLVLGNGAKNLIARKCTGVVL